MKRVFRYLFLLLTILSLSGTAQAVPTASNFMLNPVFENYSSTSGSRLPNLLDGGADWSLFTDSMHQQSKAGSFSASLTVGLRPYQDSLWGSPTNSSSSDIVFGDVPGSDGFPSDVPEPDTMMLLGSGLLVLAGIGRRFTRT